MIQERRYEEQKLVDEEIERTRLKQIEKQEKRKADQIERLRVMIGDQFIADGVAVDGVMKEKFFDIDGFGTKSRNLTVIGGILGQIMLVLNALNSYQPQQF